MHYAALHNKFPISFLIFYGDKEWKYYDNLFYQKEVGFHLIKEAVNTRKKPAVWNCVDLYVNMSSPSEISATIANRDQDCKWKN